MRLPFPWPRRSWVVLTAAVWAACVVSPVLAQHRYPACPAQPCPPVLVPYTPERLPGAMPPGAPAASATSPGQPGVPQPLDSQAPTPFDPGLGADVATAVGGASFAAAVGDPGGYLDPAVPRTMLRFRYDSAYDNNRPDRAEFFYAKCGCFRTAPFPLNDPNAAGPPLPERRVDFQEIHSYLEVALSHRLSAFVEIPIRFLNPEINSNAAGLGDLMTGFKYAAVACPDRYLTFQLRTYVPSGDSERGLGTNHVSLEPGILYQQRLGDQLTLMAEFKDWIAVDGSDYAGNILRYGIGLGYDLARTGSRQITPMIELVGWTVLSGKYSDDNDLPVDASGDTIINAKLGVRYGFNERGSLYLGYGRALTGEVWYKDILRLEYRLLF